MAGSPPPPCRGRRHGVTRGSERARTHGPHLPPCGEEVALQKVATTPALVGGAHEAVTMRGGMH
eukprot:1408199-Alexandrium_andersonii.AAC.1